MNNKIFKKSDFFQPDNMQLFLWCGFKRLLAKASEELPIVVLNHGSLLSTSSYIPDYRPKEGIVVKHIDTIISEMYYVIHSNKNLLKDDSAIIWYHKDGNSTFCVFCYWEVDNRVWNCNAISIDPNDGSWSEKSRLNLLAIL